MDQPIFLDIHIISIEEKIVAILVDLHLLFDGQLPRGKDSHFQRFLTEHVCISEQIHIRLESDWSLFWE